MTYVPKIAVIWSRFGPYHLARLRAAASSAAAQSMEIVGIEVAGSDAVYAWDVVRSREGVTAVALFPGEPYESLGEARISRAIRQQLDALDPVAVACNGWSVAEARAALAWCRSRRRPAILMSETKLDDQPRQWWRERVKSMLVRRFDAALVGGAPHRDYLVHLGFDAARIRFGYDAVDNGYFETRADAARGDAARLRSALGLPHRYFLACTRFVERKNVDGLLDAYAIYRSRAGCDAWGLVIAGSGSMEAAWKSRAARLGLDDVVWPGFLQYQDLPAYYGLASAFVHAAHQEAWGLVVNEAAAAGLPLLIAEKVGAASELLAEGKNGLSFNGKDPASLAAAMLRIASAPEEQRAGMGAQSRVIARRCSPEAFATGLLEAVAAAQAPAGTGLKFGATHG